MFFNSAREHRSIETRVGMEHTGGKLQNRFDFSLVRQRAEYFSAFADHKIERPSKWVDHPESRVMIRFSI
jgi:hypothetical protein